MVGGTNGGRGNTKKRTSKKRSEKLEIHGASNFRKRFEKIWRQNNVEQIKKGREKLRPEMKRKLPKRDKKRVKVWPKSRSGKTAGFILQQKREAVARAQPDGFRAANRQVSSGQRPRTSPRLRASVEVMRWA